MYSGENLRIQYVMTVVLGVCFGAWSSTRAADVTIAAVAVAAPSPADELPSLPAGISDVPMGTNFFVEIWARTVHPQGLSMVSTDMGFPPARLEGLSILHSELMDVFPNGAIDNVNGLINDLSGSHAPVIPACSDEIGLADWARVAIIEMVGETPGSAAITLTPSGSVVYVVALCGLLTPPSVDYLGTTITITLADEVDVVLVPVAAPSGADISPALPAALTEVMLGETFFLEVWASTSFANGLSMVSADIDFDAARLEALAITHTPLMNLFASGTLDNPNGRINDLSGSHPPVIPACSDQVGFDEWARVAWVSMRADAEGTAVMQSSSTGSPVFVVALCGQLSTPLVNYGGASIDIVDATAPSTPLSDPSGFDKCRFISMIVPPTQTAGNALTALRVTLASLHHVDPPYSGSPSIPMTAFEGQVRWVGPPASYVESTASGIPFFASILQCSPHYRDWSTVGLLHVTGSGIVPSSIYEVENLALSCAGNEANCTAVSQSLEVRTTRWGDVEIPFNPPSTTTQPDLADVSALVNKFRDAPGAPIKARALLAPEDVLGNMSPATIIPNFSFIHIAACVDAFRGAPYPATGIATCP